MNLQVKLNVLKCIPIFLYVQTIVDGFHIVKINHTTQEKFIPKLLDLINEDKHDATNRMILNHIVVKRGEGNRRYTKFDGIHKTIVKRIIPHGYEAPVFEYDKRYNTYYRPLIRIHKRKPLSEIIYNVEQKTQDSYESSPMRNKYKVFIIADKKSKIYRSLLQKLNDEDPSDVFKININKNIEETGKSVAKNNMSNKTKIDAQTYNKLLDIIKKFQSDELRRRFKKSGEEHDPLRPGIHPIYQYEFQKKTERPKKWTPHYSFWNYWTYDKKIHEDDCKGNFIKHNGVCVGGGPYRRNKNHVV